MNDILLVAFPQIYSTRHPTVANHPGFRVWRRSWCEIRETESFRQGIYQLFSICQFALPLQAQRIRGETSVQKPATALDSVSCLLFPGYDKKPSPDNPLGCASTRIAQTRSDHSAGVFDTHPPIFILLDPAIISPLKPRRLNEPFAKTERSRLSSRIDSLIGRFGFLGEALLVLF